MFSLGTIDALVGERRFSMRTLIIALAFLFVAAGTASAAPRHGKRHHHARAGKHHKKHHRR
jgi:hypothetical protein